MKIKYKTFNVKVFILIGYKIILMIKKLFKHIDYDENGEMHTNIEKLEQMVHYIISCVGNIPNVGKTVLWKLMYFSDFDYFELYEKTLTGEQYRKLEHGPAPVHFDEIIDNLKEQGKIRVMRVPYHTKTQEKYIPLTEPETNSLTKEEVFAIEKSIKRYAHLNASQISEFSHQDIPWKATDEKKLIDYKLVFYREPITSVREYRDDDNN